MSLDYCTCETARFGVVAQGSIINGSFAPLGVTLYSKNFQWMALGIAIRINTAATSATQYVALQLSDSAGSFASPTELARVTIASTDAALTQFYTAVTESLVVIPAGYLVRLAHVAPSTDATLNYDYEIYATTRNN